MHVHGFADLWEHARLLSDHPRNDALITLLRRRAPDARVLEIGCGTGLLSCVAARLGARHVHAVEPTAQIEIARQLVDANGLTDRVTLHEAAIEDLPPEPVDLVFSELLNADPFVEGLLEASDAGARWLAPGGHLAPQRLRLHLAATSSDRSAQEVSQARRALVELATAHDLRLDPLLEGLDTLEPYAYIAPTVEAVAPTVQALDLALGRGEVPPERIELRLPTEGLEAVRGVVVWFEAVLDEGLSMANPPGRPGHWGHLVLGLPRLVPAGQPLALHLSIDDDELTVGLS